MSDQDYLPLTTPRYNYEGIQQCLGIMEQMVDRDEEEPMGLSNPYVIIDIDERSFQECFVNSEEKLLTLSWKTYDHISQFAVLRLETANQAVAAGAFDTIFSAWARGVTDTLIAPTSTRSVRGSSTRKTKRPDLSWTPIDPPGGRSEKWPTLVGEVAWSEPRLKLENDVGFWLGDSDSQVKVAITITVHDRGRITIEKWGNTAAARETRPIFPTQKIEIVRNPAPGCSRVSGQLQVQFQDVFLREKKGTEADFVLTESDMEEIARLVWSFQFHESST